MDDDDDDHEHDDDHEDDDDEALSIIILMTGELSGSSFKPSSIVAHFNFTCGLSFCAICIFAMNAAATRLLLFIRIAPPIHQIELDHLVLKFQYLSFLKTALKRRSYSIIF